MGDPDDRREGRPLWQRGLVGGLLAGVALCIGIVIGSVLDAPRVLLRRLQEPTLAVELDEFGDTDAEEDLVEFRALQERATGAGAAKSSGSAGESAGQPARAALSAPAPGTAPARSPAPAPSEPQTGGSVDPGPAPPARGSDPNSPAPEAPPPKSPAPPSAVPEPPARSAPSKEELLRALAARVEERSGPSSAAARPPAPVSAASPAPVGPVVQVAAYADRAAADALAVRLRRTGHDAYVSRSGEEGAARFRVRVRPAQGTAAPEVAKRLTAEGFHVWIARE